MATDATDVRTPRGAPAALAAPFLACACAVFLAGCCGFRAPGPDRPIALPADDAAHDDAPTENWYWKAHLTAADGARYHVFYSFGRHFPCADRFAEVPLLLVASPLSSPLEASWTGIADERRGVYEADWKTNATLFWGMDADEERLALSARGWGAAAVGSGVRVTCGTDGYDLDLRFEPTEPAVAHGAEGEIVRIPPATAFRYYTFPRAVVTGTLRVGDGPAVEVSGDGWWEHQWGFHYNPRLLGWEWFGLQLSDGSEVAIALLRAQDGSIDRASFATVVAPDGTVARFGSSDLRARALERWRSPESDFEYPVAWSLRIPRAGIDLTTSPVLRQQEAPSPLDTPFWEGAVRVEGTREGTAVTGEGFTEIVHVGRPWYRRYFRSGA